jgi:hypothetical protein
MSEVELRLTQMREAAVLLDRSSRRIDVSVQNIQLILNELLMLGFDDLAGGKFALQYSQQRALMDKWTQQLALISTKLSLAADDLERALVNDFEIGGPASTSGYPVSGTPVGRFWSNLPALDTRAEPAPPVPYALDDYVSHANRPLLDELVQEKRDLQMNEARLDELLQTRQETLEDLVALKNRLISFDSDVDLNKIPRIQVLESQIVQMDQEILTIKDNIAGLHTSIGDLAARLDRVKPGAGANLRLIAGLESSETSEWVKNHTYGCVNYVVNRMPIPGGIPRHAYLWDQAAMELPQYGITSGDVPLTGSVLVLEPDHPYADDVFGHIMYVERVEHGVPWVTDNLHPDTALPLTDLIDDVTGPDMTYLYFPWHTQA